MVSDGKVGWSERQLDVKRLCFMGMHSLPLRPIFARFGFTKA
jgi:hypothetical protein